MYTRGFFSRPAPQTTFYVCLVQSYAKAVERTISCWCCLQAFQLLDWMVNVSRFWMDFVGNSRAHRHTHTHTCVIRLHWISTLFMLTTNKSSKLVLFYLLFSSNVIWSVALYRSFFSALSGEHGWIACKAQPIRNRKIHKRDQIR